MKTRLVVSIAVIFLSINLIAQQNFDKTLVRKLFKDRDGALWFLIVIQMLSLFLMKNWLTAVLRHAQLSKSGIL